MLPNQQQQQLQGQTMAYPPQQSGYMPQYGPPPTGGLQQQAPPAPANQMSQPPQYQQHSPMSPTAGHNPYGPPPPQLHQPLQTQQQMHQPGQMPPMQPMANQHQQPPPPQMQMNAQAPPPPLQMGAQQPPTYMGGPPGQYMPMASHQQQGPPPPQYQPTHPQQPYQQQHPQQPSMMNNHHMPPQPKLDLHAMPSVALNTITEWKAYQNIKELTFTAPASLPPLVATLTAGEFNLIDSGCSRPCHMRSTIYSIPSNKDLLESSGLEFSIVVKPFDEGEIDKRVVVPLSMNEIQRCNRCKAYVNPFSASGQCSICGISTGHIQEVDQPRPELHFGSYEFRVGKEYYRDQIAESRRPHIIFAIEMTNHSRHMVEHISKHLANVIRDHFPTDFLYSQSLSPLVGFATYNSKITLYDIVNGCAAFIMSDMTSVIDCASTSKFLVDPKEHFEQIQKFLASLPHMLNEQPEEQTVLGPVIEAVLKTCLHDTSNNFQKNHNPKVVPTGKVYLLHSSLPTSGDDTTPGRLSTKRNIDEMKRHLNTDTEAKVLAPDGKYYTQLAEKCMTEYASGVELFLFPPHPRAYLNISTIGDLARLTGTGAINKYHLTSMDDFIEDLKFSLKATIGFDASMRVRTSTGISADTYIGNFKRVDSNLEMAAVNTTSNFVVQMKYDDKLPENDLVIVQFAMIYTSLCGERRVRVHNLALSTCQVLADVYKQACCDTLVNVLVRDALDKMRAGTITPRAAKEKLTNRIINILAAYRKNCTEISERSTTQLILPEGLKLLPVYLCGILKCDAIGGGFEMFPDDKVLAQMNLIGALPAQSQATIYPRMYSIEACEADDEENETGLTEVLERCYSLAIEEARGQCYVLENGYYLFIYIPNNELGQAFLAGLFGPQKDSPDLVWAQRVSGSNETTFMEGLLKRIFKERKRALRVLIVRQGRDKLEPVFKSFLYEDKRKGGSGFSFDDPSYVDTLCYLHNQIRAKMSQ